MRKPSKRTLRAHLRAALERHEDLKFQLSHFASQLAKAREASRRNAQLLTSALDAARRGGAL